MARRVLITGASIAGNTAAWWLARRGFDVEVVEKAPSFRDSGQIVDVRGAGREVLRQMSLEQAALDRRTGELGTDWVNEDDRVIARFAVEDLHADYGPTAELEIMRGDIARVIYEGVGKQATYRFGDSIAAVEQDASAAEVTFVSGRRERYDVVVVAEGVGSSTREMLFPGENRPRWMDLTIAFFAIPKRAGDSPYARQYNTVGGRGATLKPARNTKLSVNLGMQKRPGGEHEWTVDRQKQFMQDKFAGDHWEFPRVLEAMSQTDDFYFDVLRQVRMDRWSDRHVVLVGDAAWCPTPLSGIGTTLAIVGGYVLAGEIAKTDDPAQALRTFEAIMRPFVKEGQSLPKIVPRLLWPHSRAGLALQRGAMRVLARPRVRNTFFAAVTRNSNSIELPRY